ATPTVHQMEICFLDLDLFADFLDTDISPNQAHDGSASQYNKSYSPAGACLLPDELRGITLVPYGTDFEFSGQNTASSSRTSPRVRPLDEIDRRTCVWWISACRYSARVHSVS